MARYGRLLTDAHWEMIAPLLPKLRKSGTGGRPRTNDGKVLEGLLWILRSGRFVGRICPRNSPHGNLLEAASDWEEQQIWLTIWRAFLAN